LFCGGVFPPIGGNDGGGNLGSTDVGTWLSRENELKGVGAYVLKEFQGVASPAAFGKGVALPMFGNGVAFPAMLGKGVAFPIIGIPLPMGTIPGLTNGVGL
jgi:hypothetical protein